MVKHVNINKKERNYYWFITMAIWVFSTIRIYFPKFQSNRKNYPDMLFPWLAEEAIFINRFCHRWRIICLSFQEPRGRRKLRKIIKLNIKRVFFFICRTYINIYINNIALSCMLKIYEFYIQYIWIVQYIH